MKNLILAALLLGAFIAPVAHAQTGGVFNVGAAVNGNAGGVKTTATVGAKATTTAPTKEIQIRTAADVVTDADLNLYEDNISMTNARIVDADSSKAKIALSYEHKGSFLGFIPVMIETRTTATIADDGTLAVSTTIPWWNFLVTGTGDVRATVDAELTGSATLLGALSASDDSNARARALDTIAAAHVKAQAGE